MVQRIPASVSKSPLMPAMVVAFSQDEDQQVCFCWPKNSYHERRIVAPFVGEPLGVVRNCQLHPGQLVTISWQQRASDWYVVDLLLNDRNNADPLLFLSQAREASDYVFAMVMRNVGDYDCTHCRRFYFHWHAGHGMEQWVDAKYVWDRLPLHRFGSSVIAHEPAAVRGQQQVCSSSSSSSSRPAAATAAAAAAGSQQGNDSLEEATLAVVLAASEIEEVQFQ